jgi:16S rRNA (cytosine1407-C5)-methyltransferase
LVKLSENIKNYLSSLYNEDEAEKYFTFVTSEPSNYIRVKQNCNRETILKNLSDYGIELEKISYIENAFRVLSGHEFIGKTLEFALGYYYVQSLSSMIPPLVLAPNPNDKILDLCSAPGSKTTEIADLMNNKGTIISNEPNLDRIKMLVHNLDRMNVINTGVIQNRGEWLNRYYDNYFDKILVDAPCSALGVVQKKGEVNNWWTIERLPNLAKIQLMLLTSAVKMVKTGGEIVYSTCTLTPEENELIINYVINKFPLEVLDIELPIKSTEAKTVYKGEKLNPELKKAKRILPWEVNSDGFFIVKLKKLDIIKNTQSLVKKGTGIQLLSYKNSIVNKALLSISHSFKIPKEIWENFQFLIKGNDIFFTSKEWQECNTDLFTRIGTRFGMFDKFGDAHLHSFAAQLLSSEIQENIYELTNEFQLKEYLAGRIIKTSIQLKGQKIIKYKDYILGTAVTVNMGLKSQFPKSKRIDDIKF